MPTKPIPKKGAAKKPAAVKKPAPAAAVKKPASKPAAAKAPAGKPAAKPAAHPAAKPMAKAAPKPPAARPVAVVPAPVPPPSHDGAGSAATAAVQRPLPAKPSTSTPAGALTLSIQTSAGAASNGNTQPANILVIVTSGGLPLTELSRDHFTLMEHFEVPGQQAPFSNNITSFRNAGTGAYLLQTKPITGAPWRSGHHLAQLLVCSGDDRQGHAALKIVIR
jgi:hypothetical protein